jgi:Transposase, Mutator family
MTSRDRAGAPAGARSVPVVGEEPGMREWAAELVERARTDGVELTGESGLLKALVRQVLQTGLEVEMTDHLGYEPYAPEGRGTGNSRNGHYPKTVTTEIGEVELRVPRDRNASFEPATVRKGQRRLDGLTGNVISLYVVWSSPGCRRPRPAGGLRRAGIGQLPSRPAAAHARLPRQWRGHRGWRGEPVPGRRSRRGWGGPIRRPGRRGRRGSSPRSACRGRWGRRRRSPW